MKKKLKIIATALIVICITLLVIYLFSEGKKREVKNTVITYNEVLRKAHIDMNASVLAKLTSEKQLKKVDSYIAFNVKSGRVIDGELRDLQFKDIIVQEDSAVAVTMERWVWKYLDPVSKQPVSDEFDDMYGNTYSLAKVEGHWVIDDINSNVIEASPKQQKVYTVTNEFVNKEIYAVIPAKAYGSVYDPLGHDPQGANGSQSGNPANKELDSGSGLSADRQARNDIFITVMNSLVS